MCGCNRKVSGMARKKQKKGSFQKALTMGAAGSAALLAARMATEKVEFLNSNPLVSAGAKIAAGAFAATQKNEIVQGAGFGLIAGGGLDLLDHYMPSGISATPRQPIRRVVRGLPGGHYRGRPAPQRVPQRAAVIL